MISRKVSPTRSHKVPLFSGAVNLSRSSWATLGDCADLGVGFGGIANQTAKTNFWTNIDDGNGTPNIWRMRERVLIGDAVKFTGTRAGDPGGAWLSSHAVGANWAIRDAQLGVMSSRGMMAVVGYSRTSDSDDLVSAAAIGASGLVINNSTKTKAAWGLYSDTILTNSLGTVYGCEFGMRNASGVNQTAAPYHAVAGTVGLWLVAGGDPSYGPVNTDPCNSAIQIGGNATTWNKGIVFYDKLTRDPTYGRANAIEMCRFHNVNWYKPDGSVGFQITSGVNTGEIGVTLLALANAFHILGGGGHPAFVFYDDTGASAANYARVSPGVAGAPVRYMVGGTDTDIDLAFVPQGAGKVSFGTKTVGAVSTDGYITIKDSVGNLVKLVTAA